MGMSEIPGFGFGQIWQTVARVSGTTYYNTTGKPILLVITGTPNLNTVSTLTVNGVVVNNFAGTNNYDRTIVAVIPVNASYVASYAFATPGISELR